MERILDDLHDAVLTSLHLNAEENCVMEFSGPHPMRRWLTLAADAEPDIWLTEGDGLSSVGTVWSLPVSEVDARPNR